MKVIFRTDKVFGEFTQWATEDKKLFKKIATLIGDIKRSPYEGIGKPEPLKHELSGYWSRRINEEHRLVYQVIEGEDEITLVIISCKNHYS
jgi:toxin YoeB